jgi:hypothetical protein
MSFLRLKWSEPAQTVIRCGAVRMVLDVLVQRRRAVWVSDKSLNYLAGDVNSPHPT